MASTSGSIVSKFMLGSKTPDEEFNKQMSLLERSIHVRLKLVGEHSLSEGENVRYDCVRSMSELYDKVEAWLEPKLGIRGNWQLSNAGGWPLQEEAMSRPTSSTCPLVVNVRNTDARQSGSYLDDMRQRLEERLASLKIETDKDIKALKKEVKEQSEKITDLTAQVAVWKPGGQADKSTGWWKRFASCRKWWTLMWMVACLVAVGFYVYHEHKLDHSLDTLKKKVKRYATIEELQDLRNNFSELENRQATEEDARSYLRESVQNMSFTVNATLVKVGNLSTALAQVNSTFQHDKHQTEVQQLTTNLTTNLSHVNFTLWHRIDAMEASILNLTKEKNSLATDLHKVETNVSRLADLHTALSGNLSKVHGLVKFLNHHSVNLTAELSKVNGTLCNRSELIEVSVAKLKQNLTGSLDQVNGTLHEANASLQKRSNEIEAHLEASVKNLTTSVESLNASIKGLATDLHNLTEDLQKVHGNLTNLSNITMNLTANLSQVNTSLQTRGDQLEASIRDISTDERKNLSYGLRQVNANLHDLRSLTMNLTANVSQVNGSLQASVVSLTSGLRNLTNDLDKVHTSLHNLSMRTSANLSQVNDSFQNQSAKVEASLANLTAGVQNLTEELNQVNTSLHNLSMNLTTNISQVNATSQAWLGVLVASVSNLTHHLNLVNGSLDRLVGNATANQSKVEARLHQLEDGLNTTKANLQKAVLADSQAEAKLGSAIAKDESTIAKDESAIAKDEQDIRDLKTTSTTTTVVTNSPMMLSQAAHGDQPVAGFLETPRNEGNIPSSQQQHHTPSPTSSASQRLAGIDAQLSRIVNRLDDSKRAS